MATATRPRHKPQSRAQQRPDQGHPHRRHPVAEGVDHGNALQTHPNATEELEEQHLPPAGPQEKRHAGRRQEELLGAGAGIKGRLQPVAQGGLQAGKAPRPVPRPQQEDAANPAEQEHRQQNGQPASPPGRHNLLPQNVEQPQRGKDNGQQQRHLHAGKDLCPHQIRPGRHQGRHMEPAQQAPPQDQPHGQNPIPGQPMPGEPGRHLPGKLRNPPGGHTGEDHRREQHQPLLHPCGLHL